MVRVVRLYGPLVPKVKTPDVDLDDERKKAEEAARRARAEAVARSGRAQSILAGAQSTVGLGGRPSLLGGFRS